MINTGHINVPSFDIVINYYKNEVVLKLHTMELSLAHRIFSYRGKKFKKF